MKKFLPTFVYALLSSLLLYPIALAFILGINKVFGEKVIQFGEGALLIFILTSFLILVMFSLGLAVWNYFKSRDLRKTVLNMGAFLSLIILGNILIYFTLNSLSVSNFYRLSEKGTIEPVIMEFVSVKPNYFDSGFLKELELTLMIEVPETGEYTFEPLIFTASGSVNHYTTATTLQLQPGAKQQLQFLLDMNGYVQANSDESVLLSFDNSIKRNTLYGLINVHTNMRFSNTPRLVTNNYLKSAGDIVKLGQFALQQK